MSQSFEFRYCFGRRAAGFIERDEIDFRDRRKMLHEVVCFDPVPTDKWKREAIGKKEYPRPRRDRSVFGMSVRMPIYMAIRMVIPMATCVPIRVAIRRKIAMMDGS